MKTFLSRLLIYVRTSTVSANLEQRVRVTETDKRESNLEVADIASDRNAKQKSRSVVRKLCVSFSGDFILTLKIAYYT
jgi:hypothetical protein